MSKLINKKELTSDDSINNNNNNINKVAKVKFSIGKTPSNDSLNSIQNEDALLNGNGKNTSPDSSDDSKSNGLFR